MNKDQDKTKEQLINKLNEMRQRIAELETAEAEHKRVEEELRLRAKLLDSASDSIILFGLDGNFVYVNETFCRSHGYSREELLKMNICQLDSLLTSERLESWIKELGENGEAVHEAFHSHKDGSTSIFEAHSGIIESGGKKFVLSVERDITERKKMEEALELQKAYFQQLFDNSPDAIALLDETDRVIQVNKGFEALFGYRPEEVKGQPMKPIVVPEDRIEEATIIAQTALNNQMVRVETMRKRKDDSLVDVSLLHYPIQSGGKTVGVYAIYTDITERKQTEAEKEKLIKDLKASLEKVQTLSGLLPICAWCKQIRDDQGYWQSVEEYIGEHAKVEFSHSICPACREKYGPK